jgi:hypothetical protein
MRWQHLSPTGDGWFTSWWVIARKAIHKARHKAFDSLVLLVAQSLWLERNNQVFNFRSVLPSSLVYSIKLDCDQWCWAGLVDMSSLVRD